MDLSIVILARNEEDNIGRLIRNIKSTISDKINKYEILVIDGYSKDKTRFVAEEAGAKVISQSESGYGGALKDGFRYSQAEYIITMDADYSHSPEYILDMWEGRGKAELLIASRYVDGGLDEMSWLRKLLSRFLNKVYAYILILPYKDISSGYRMYNKRVMDGLEIERGDFSILEELLVKIHCGGWRIKEIPFHYYPREKGSSSARLFRLAISYLATLGQMWRLRHTVFSADYDYRAYYSRIPLQRYWQRKRYKIIMGYIADKRGKIIDIGCGSSKIIQDLPMAIGVDINIKCLRYLKNNIHNLLVCANIFNIPFKDEEFGTVICSQLIEHIPKDRAVFDELFRVTKKGGTLIIGIPDYSRISWRFFEWMSKRIIPGGHLDMHYYRYTREELISILKSYNLQIDSIRYVLGSEVIIKAKKS